MCIIVDADVCHTMFSQPSDAGLTVRDWIERGSGKMVFGGRNAEELFKNQNAKAWILEAWRSGRAIQVSEDRIKAELTAIKSAKLSSNDGHVIALARASGARALYSDDNNLISDFKNKSIVSPRGRVFRRPEHRRTVLATNAC